MKSYRKSNKQLVLLLLLSMLDAFQQRLLQTTQVLLLTSGEIAVHLFPSSTKNVISSQSLRCWLLYVKAASILCNRVITINDLSITDQYLQLFCQKLYGSQSCTPNMHLHLHLHFRLWTSVFFLVLRIEEIQWPAWCLLVQYYNLYPLQIPIY